MLFRSESRTALFDFQRAEDERMAKQGLARLKDTWVPIADAPFLRLGWVRDASLGWLSPLTKVRLDREQDLAAKGWQQQDLEWIPPEQFESWKKGLWKCGEEWVDNEGANTWHADMNRPWYVASEHFVISTTVERDRVEWCKWYADQTYADLVRLFGVAPGSRLSAVDLLGPKRDKPELYVLRNLEQFNKVAASGAETDGFSSLHYAYFADAWYDTSVKPAAYAGIGVGFWDNGNKTLDGFGQYSIRHAAALSFVEAIDPSWRALGDMAMGVQAKSTTAFWATTRAAMSERASIPDALVQRLRRAAHVVVLTGAGISAESGVPTFRQAQTGLWAQYDPQALATPQAFRRQPQLVWDWF